MPFSMKDLEPILKEVYRQQLDRDIKDMARMNAIRLGWKRDRTNRIKWINVQKKKLRKLFNA